MQRLRACLVRAHGATAEEAHQAKAAAAGAAKAAAIAAAADTTDAKAAERAAKAAERAAQPSSASWFAKGSAMRAHWNRPDGFDGMQHRSLVVGPYVPDVLHAVELRFIGSIFSRLLRLARLIDSDCKENGMSPLNVFARVRQTLEAIPAIRLTDARGSWHIRQLHGKQVKSLMDDLDARSISNAYPDPWRGAIRDLLDIWPFYVEATGHALYPTRAYRMGCGELSANVRAAAHVLHVGMSSMFPAVLKDPEDAGKGYYGAFTPPSNYVAVTDVPDIFEAQCEASGSAALSAAVFEYGHIPCRKIYWATTTRGTRFGGRSQHVELLQNMALQKVAVWGTFGSSKLFPNLRYARMRHHRAEVKYRQRRERFLAALRRWHACAHSPWTCTHAAIAADGSGAADGFHRDSARNLWLGAKHVGIELDDTPAGTEADDDLPIATTGPGEVGAREEPLPECGGDCEGSDEDSLDIGDAQELQQLEPAAEPPVPEATDDAYEAALEEQEEESTTTLNGEPEAQPCADIDADGEVLVDRDVPSE